MKIISAKDLVLDAYSFSDRSQLLHSILPIEESFHMDEKNEHFTFIAGLDATEFGL